MSYPFQYRQMRDRIRFLELLLGSSVYNMAGGLLLGFLTMYLVDYISNSSEEGGLGLEESLYSFTLALCVLAYMFTTVITGVISDSFRGEYGNRIPFVIGGGTLIAVLFVFGYLTLKNHNDLWLMAILMLVFISVARGISASPFNALMSELFEKDQRGWAALTRTMFSAIGTGIAIAIFPFFAKKGDYPEMFLIIAVVYLFATSITGIMVPKLNPDFPPDDIWSDIFSTPRILWDYGRGEFGKMLISQFFWGLGTGTINFFWVLYVRRKLGEPVEAGFGILILIGVFAAIWMIPTGFFVARFGKVITGAFASALFMIFIFLVMTASELETLYFYAPIGGAAIIGLSTVTQSLPADLVPEGKEAQFFGINTIFTMLPDPITFTIAGFILSDIFASTWTDRFNILFSIAIFEIAIATVFLLWIEYESWFKEEYEHFYTRFLRAKNKLPDRTWAGITFKEYFYKKPKTLVDDLDAEEPETYLRNTEHGIIEEEERRRKNRIKEW